ncbi:MAG: methane monooxygenase/ammonia monooxygenase subunit C [Micromonosporaceae bacterium]
MVLIERAQHVWESSVSGPPVPARDGDASVRDVGRVWQIAVPLLVVLAIAGFWRLWQQAFAFDNGLDATMPYFDQYWMTIFYVNIVGLPMVASAGFAWLILSGAKAARTALTPVEETHRIWRLWLIIAAFTAAAYAGGSYFAEQDAAWHQVTLRDTAFTPSHIGLFYGAFPLMIYFSFAAYLYGRTRLPHLFGGKTLPLSFALVVGGTLLLMFQVAFNEFGHTFWQTEEVFSAPLHWPFVIFAYLLFATFAIWFATAIRLGTLIRNELPPLRTTDDAPSDELRTTEAS